MSFRKAHWDAQQIVRTQIPAENIAEYQVSPVFAGRDPVALLAAQVNHGASPQ